MSETPEHTTETTGPIATEPVTQAPATEVVAVHRPSRLNQVAAWVGIVAGVVFIVGAIFFSGFFLGKHSGGGGGGHGHWRQHDAMKFEHHPPFPMGPMGPPGFMFPRGPGGQGGPGGPGFQPPEPPQGPGAPSSTGPARPS